MFLRPAIAWKKEQKTSNKSEAGLKSPEHLLDARRVPDLARNLKRRDRSPATVFETRLGGRRHPPLLDLGVPCLAKPNRGRLERTTEMARRPSGHLNRPRHEAPVGGGITHSLSKGACGTPPKVARVARPVARPPPGAGRGEARGPPRHSWRGRVRPGRPCGPCTSPVRPRPPASQTGPPA